MMVERIIAAFSFRKGIYKEVEEDQSFTNSAWIIVSVVALLSSFGSNAVALRSSFGSWFIGSIFRAVFMIAGFALGCFIINWVSNKLFNADTNFNELVRTLGLAYVWNGVSFLSIISAISPALSCVTGIFTFAGVIAGLVAWVFAAREALDLEWGETILTIVIAAVGQGILLWLSGLILAALGLGVGTSVLRLIR
ncbi:MAG: hypothetical protein GYA18_07040 [Chloroflexi bacterium]|nr:hypothetical protein [Chloroflexota bacterium]